MVAEARAEHEGKTITSLKSVGRVNANLRT
jgi:hypothetical protein